MEQYEETITRTVFKDKCPTCGKEMKGTSEAQVRYNMDIHVFTKHTRKKNKK